MLTFLQNALLLFLGKQSHFVPKPFLLVQYLEKPHLQSQKFQAYTHPPPPLPNPEKADQNLFQSEYHKEFLSDE